MNEEFPEIYRGPAYYVNVETHKVYEAQMLQLIHPDGTAHWYEYFPNGVGKQYLFKGRMRHPYYFQKLDALNYLRSLLFEKLQQLGADLGGIDAEIKASS